jgi:hypothetical protein
MFWLLALGSRRGQIANQETKPTRWVFCALRFWLLVASGPTGPGPGPLKLTACGGLCHKPSHKAEGRRLWWLVACVCVLCVVDVDHVDHVDVDMWDVGCGV